MVQLYSDSVLYHCTIHKSKTDYPYLLMLHGFMGSGALFHPLIDHLKQFCNPVTIDLSGHGQTKTPETDGILTTERQVHQLRSILKRLNFSDLYIYGYSMGGRVAFQLISNCAKYFKSAIIESAHCGFEAGHKKNKRKELDEKRALQIEQNFSGFVDKWLDLPLFKHTPLKASNRYEHVIKSQNPSMMARSLREFGSGSMPDICKNLPATLPIHLISGSLDKKYVQLQKDIATQSPAWSHYNIEEAGHRVHTDKPNRVIEIIKEAMNPIQIQPDL